MADNKKIYLTPGPTELYPEVKKFIADAIDKDICCLSHRSQQFMDIYKHTFDNLKQLLNIPDNFHMLFVSSATECMDVILRGCVKEYSFHFVNGGFSKRFFNIANELEKKARKIDVPYGESFPNINDIDIPGTPELIAITQNETSTGVAIQSDYIASIKKRFPDSILAVDIVTAAPYMKLDYSNIDASFFSVQKGFGMPSGLGVLFVNEKVIERSGKLRSEKIHIGGFHNMIWLHENAIKFQTSETPNVLGIYLIGKVAEHLNNYGVDKMRKETEEKAKLLYNFFDNSEFKPFVRNKQDRSQTVIVIDTPNPKEIKDKLAKQGYIIGSGYGDYLNSQIRIANFPMHKIEWMEGIISIIKNQ